MAHSRNRIVWLALLLSLASTGCASLGPNGKAWRWLQSGDPDNDNNEKFKDKWSQVGQEGRGGRELEDEHDPFNNWLRSPKAAAIENNLGIK
jgi:hypothetical protein